MINRNTRQNEQEYMNKRKEAYKISKGNTEASKDMSHFDTVQNKEQLLGGNCKYPMTLLMPVMGILL
jgi:hypothetical protein